MKCNVKQLHLLIRFCYTKSVKVGKNMIKTKKQSFHYPYAQAIP